MTKKAEKLKTTAELARLLKRTESAITKAYRSGRFGSTVQLGPRGELLFTWPAAGEVLRRNTDHTRLPVDKLPAPAVPQVMVWEGPGGRYEAPREVADALMHANAHPDEALLSPELVAHLDRIMDVMHPRDEGAAP